MLKVLGIRRWASWTDDFEDHLPSSNPAFPFNVKFTMRYQSTKEVASSEALALASRRVRAITEPVASRSDVLRPSSTQHDMNHALNLWFVGNTPTIKFESALVTVRVDDLVSRVATSYAHSAREMLRENLERDRVRAELQFFRDEVFRDPATARLYWVAKHPDWSTPPDLQKIVGIVNQWSERNRWVIIAQVLQQFLEQYPERNALDLARLLERLTRESGRADLADMLAPFCKES